MTVDTVEQLDEMRAVAMKSMVSLSDETARYLAMIVRKADDAAGLVTVPREPTELMLNEADALDIEYSQGGKNAGSDYAPVGEVYSAMIAASPFSKG